MVQRIEQILGEIKRKEKIIDKRGGGGRELGAAEVGKLREEEEKGKHVKDRQRMRRGRGEEETANTARCSDEHRSVLEHFSPGMSWVSTEINTLHK